MGAVWPAACLIAVVLCFGAVAETVIEEPPPPAGIILLQDEGVPIVLSDFLDDLPEAHKDMPLHLHPLCIDLILTVLAPPLEVAKFGLILFFLVHLGFLAQHQALFFQ